MNLQLIVGIVAVLVILLVALVVIGLSRKKAKTVTFDNAEKESPKELTQEEKSGNYQANGGFNFAPAKPQSEKEPVLLDGQLLHEEEQDLPQEDQSTVVLEDDSEEVADTSVPAPSSESISEEIHEAEEDEALSQSAPVSEVPSAPAAIPLDESLEAETEETFHELDEFEDIAEAAAQEEAEETGEEDENPSVQEEDSAEAQLDTIDPATGRLGRLRGRLARSNNVFGKSVLGMLSAGDLDEQAWEDIEDELLQADLGATTTMAVVDQLRELIASRGVNSEDEARAMLRECLIAAAKPEMDRSIKSVPYEGKPAVVLVVGVNGTGKTTTTGKLARVLASMDHSVVLGAADTFRAAAADQLETWGRRVGARTIRGKEGADPASVAFDAVAQGIDSGADVVLIDTAGRLHNSTNLMDQLGKVKRVVEKKADVDEVLLVLDATTGQNALHQAKIFGDVVDITGVVLTKLDGTAKGGSVFRIQEELGVPVKLVGLGEGADDLAPFEVESFVDALLAGK